MTDSSDAAASAWIDRSRVDDLLAKSRSSERKRSHLLLHSGPGDQVQRLLIAAQPGTYVRPHQHSQQWEMLTLLAGALDFFLLDEEGRIVARRELNASSPLIQIEPGVWHSCVIKEADTIALEVKPGPYSANEFAPWAPEEGTFNSEKMLLRMQRGRIGDLLRAED